MTHDHIADAITAHYGSRCPDTEPGCPCCDAWAQYDALRDDQATRDAAEDLTVAYMAGRHDGLKSAAEKARNHVAQVWAEAIEAAADWCADEASRCDDAAKWGGDRKYIANCKAAAYALRNACNHIRALKQKEPKE